MHDIAAIDMVCNIFTNEVKQYRPNNRDAFYQGKMKVDGQTMMKMKAEKGNHTSSTTYLMQHFMTPRGFVSSSPTVAVIGISSRETAYGNGVSLEMDFQNLF